MHSADRRLEKSVEFDQSAEQYPVYARSDRPAGDPSNGLLPGVQASCGVERPIHRLFSAGPIAPPLFESEGAYPTSWFETTGLSSLEAAALGCNIVITNKGDTKEYFGDQAWYCDPSSPDSIRRAVDEAAASGSNGALQKKIVSEYTWARPQ